MKRIYAVLGAAIPVLAFFPIAHVMAAEATADLKVSLTGLGSVAPGSRITYQMTIQNQGPDAVDSASLSYGSNPIGYLSAPSVTGNSNTNGNPIFCTQLPPNVTTCPLANMPMPPGETRTITFTTTVSETASAEVVFTAGVSASVDPVPSDNSGQVKSTIVVPPEPKSAKTEIINSASTTSFTKVVTFTKPFSTVPAVTTNINAGSGVFKNWNTRAFNITTTGFTLWVYAGPGVAAQTITDLPVQWMAIGT